MQDRADAQVETCRDLGIMLYSKRWVGTLGYAVVVESAVHSPEITIRVSEVKRMVIDNSLRRGPHIDINAWTQRTSTRYWKNTVTSILRELHRAYQHELLQVWGERLCSGAARVGSLLKVRRE